MSQQTRRIALRILLLLAGALFIPACSDSDDGGSGFMDLFIDDFDNGLGLWTIIHPAVDINPFGIGRGPSMHVAASGAPGEVRTTSTFSTSTGLTISVDIKANASTADFQIVNAAAPGTRDTFVQIGPDFTVYSIQGASHLEFHTPDSHVHKYLFHVENGQAQWQRDGIVHQQGAFGAASVFLDCQDESSGADFDLVHVSTP
jgi:hypothetical protein